MTDSSLDRLRPLERRADLVLQLTRRGRPVLTIVVEVQGRPDDRKWLAWTEHLIAARRTCPACVLVVTSSAREAARARAREEALAARRATLLRLMDKSGFALSDAQRRKVERCAEARQLDRWIDRVLTASSSREVLAAPRRPGHSEPTATRTSKSAAPRRARRA